MSSSFGGRAGPGAWAWAVIALGLAPPALADTIYLNARGAARRAELDQAMAPARTFSDSTGLYIRGRVVGYRKGDLTATDPRAKLATLYVDPWHRNGPDDELQWGNPDTPVEVSLSDVSRVVYEVDDDFDLRLMVSGRDQADADRPAAPIRPDGVGYRWRVRMNLALDPDGSLRLATPATDGERKRILDEERGRDWSTLEQPGWIVEALTNPLLQLKPDASAEDYQKLRDAVNQRLTQSQEHDPFHPFSMTGRPDEVVRSLLEAAARTKRHPGLASRQRPQQPSPSNVPFDVKCEVVASLLCSLAGLPEPAQADTTPRAERARRFRAFGYGARSGLIGVLEAAGPGRIALEDAPDVVARWWQKQGMTGQPPRRPPLPPEAARLAVDPSEVAIEALGLLTIDTFRLYRQADAERLMQAIISLGRRLDPDDPRAQDRARRTGSLQLEAKKALILLLRPDLSEADDDMRAKLTEAGKRFRDHLRQVVLDEDPAVRGFIEQTLAEAGTLPPIATRPVIEGLFGAAMADVDERAAPEGVDAREHAARLRLRREQRRYAVTILMVLGTLADEAHGEGTTEDEKEIAREVIERVQRLRDAVAGKTASQSQAQFVRLLDRLPQMLADSDPQLSRRAGRFLEVERRVARDDAPRRLEAASGDLRAAMERGDAPEDVDRLRADVERLRGRSDRLR